MSLISKTLSLYETASRLTCFPALTFVRWRKPRHLPKARSKIYIVRQPTPKDPEEMKLMRMRTNQYNTEMRSIRSHLVQVIEEVNKEKKKKMLTFGKLEREQEWTRMITQNEQWNINVAKNRELRQSKDAAARLDEINRIKSVRERRAARRHQEATERVAYELDQVDNFITESNADEVIDRLLDSTENYLFAVDLKGNVIGAESKERVTDSEPTVSEVPPT
ncbi:probable 28S ribosomal protein S26, mitochondrial [Pecten maximus]|uniref:probable 28S ribosomal protein S26, mitochondrial n=1 Tax=Pecten maximus TaxID=6579 RepID=UPI0014588541|nr:probable 28S ribosomal protein S26, mitochondrial [Pecten maximus]